MKKFDYNLSRNCYGDAYVPYEIAKVMKEKGFKTNRNIKNFIFANNIAFYLNGNLTTYSLINDAALATLQDSFEIVECPTVHEAMKWVNETMRTYVNIEIGIDDSCNPIYRGNLVKFPHIDDCDQDDPSAYVNITNDSHWHCYRNDNANGFDFMSIDIVRCSEDELYLDVLVYLLNIH